jgi:hypothetical protein
MRKSVISLAITTVLFAALSAYLALQLRGRDASAPTALLATCPAASKPHPSSANASPPHADAAAIPAGAAPVCDDRRAEFDRANAEAQAKYMAQLRIDLADPAKRAAMIDQGKRMLRASEPRLASYMGLKDREFDAFIALLAEQNLAYTETHARCSPHCPRVDSKALVERKNQAIRELLGDEAIERYNQYEQSRSERAAVENFRSSLPDKLSMTDDQYERLITALADEHQKFEREAATRGLKTAGSGGSTGMLYWDESHHSVEERLAAARQYSERLRSRASGVLTTDQARRYDEAQESALANLESFLPWQDTMKVDGLAEANAAN